MKANGEWNFDVGNGESDLGMWQESTGFLE